VWTGDRFDIRAMGTVDPDCEDGIEEPHLYSFAFSRLEVLGDC
jgi:hypothetical protein